MKQQNSTIKIRLSILLLLSIICSSSALIEKWVGKGETYATAAIGSLPKPTSEDVRIHVIIPPEGWVEDNLDIDVTGILSSPAALTVEYVDKSTTTFYVGDDLEYRRNNNQYTVIENYSGLELVSNRTYTINDAATAQNQYFIKNHLGSTVTLVDKDGKCVAPVYDYFAYGKQIAENTSPQQVTQTFTGKELDLFEKNAATGEDGEGLYYFGKRYYDTDVGIFTSTDPAEQFWNSYSYCGGNPVMFTDPTGMKAEDSPNFVYRMALIFLSYTNPDLAEELLMAPEVVSFGALAENISAWKFYHYNRNLKNSQPNELTEALWSGKYILLPAWASTYHTQGEGNRGNYKLVSLDGHNEAVYNAWGNPVFDVRNYATYNFYGPDDAVGHFMADMLPYYLWKSTAEDPTTKVDMLKASGRSIILKLGIGK
ncbi:MAG: RHS repeat-associated core domain-containing protein [Fibrobacter sp.]|nr:RHS repeat-associated core domain-containing protein [Fibrobacter sp.]